MSKLKQKELDELTSMGELRSSHNRISSRPQTMQRVRFLAGCSPRMLDALAAFESWTKRSLLGQGHAESPLTHKLLGTNGTLCMNEAEPWKTEAWQVELVTLLSDRSFKHNMQKPFESAATWAHVARVTPGLVEALRGPGFGRPPGPPRPDGAARPLIRHGRDRRTEGSERRTTRSGRGRRGWAFGGAVGPLEARLGCWPPPGRGGASRPLPRGEGVGRLEPHPSMAFVGIPPGPSPGLYSPAARAVPPARTDGTPTPRCRIPKFK